MQSIYTYFHYINKLIKLKYFPVIILYLFSTVVYTSPVQNLVKFTNSLITKIAVIED